MDCKGRVILVLPTSSAMVLMATLLVTVLNLGLRPDFTRRLTERIIAVAHGRT